MVGAEIAGHDLRLAAVKRGLRGCAVLHAAILKDFDRQDPLALRPQVDEFLKRARVDASHVVIGLPRSSVVLRFLQFPAAVRENLKNILEYQVENYEPIDRAELAYAHELTFDVHGRRRLSWSNKNAPDKFDVLLVMARAGEIAGFQKSLEQLRLHARFALCASLGLLRTMPRESGTGQPEKNVIIRLEEDSVELIAVVGEAMRATRYGRLGEPQGRGERILSELDRLCAECRFELKDVQNFWVTGGEAPNVLAELRQQASSLPWHPLRCPAWIQCALRGEEFQLYAAAIGVAVKALEKGGVQTDLIGRGAGAEEVSWRWVPTYALAGVALLMLGAGAVLPFYQQRQFLGQLNTEIHRLQPEVRRVEHLETSTDQLRQRVSVLDQLRATDARTLDALRELSEILPDKTWINEMNLRGDTVEISGFADSATALIPILDQSTVFQDAALASGISKDRSGKEIFRIRMKFKY